MVPQLIQRIIRQLQVRETVQQLLFQPERFLTVNRVAVGIFDRHLDCLARGRVGGVLE